MQYFGVCTTSSETENKTAASIGNKLIMTRSCC